LKPLSLLRFLISSHPPTPISLVHFVTAQCNAKCRHCFLNNTGHLSAGRELTLAEIETIADSIRDRVYHVSLGGGEPTLRPDLTEIALAYRRWARVRSMLITSNGSNPEKLTETVTRVLEEPIDLVVSLSIDEIGQSHDASRCIPGLFESLIRAYRSLLPLKTKGLSLNFNFTLSLLNQDRSVNILEQAMEMFPQASFSLTAVRGRPSDPDAGQPDARRYASAASVIRNRIQTGHPGAFENFSFGREVLNAREKVLHDLIYQTLSGQQPTGPCFAGRLTGVLTAGGDVYPCEILESSAGNIRDFSLNLPALWTSPQSEAMRKSVNPAVCACTYECAWGTNVIFSKRRIPALLAALYSGGKQ
jgi:MoaA/NifB/PqqE/SkfB family radical SAM enzyme